MLQLLILLTGLLVALVLQSCVLVHVSMSGMRRFSNSLKRYSEDNNNTDHSTEARGARNTTLFGM